MLTLKTSTSNKSEELGGTLEGTPCYTNTQHFIFREQQMNQLQLSVKVGSKASMAATTKGLSTNKLSS